MTKSDCLRIACNQRGIGYLAYREILHLNLNDMEQDVLDKDLLIENSEQKHEYAGFWIRVGASFIDMVVYLPIMGLNMYNLYSLKSLPLQLLTTLILVVYKPFMEYRYGATLGKMAVKIKVIDKDSNGLSIQKAVIRNTFSLLGQALSLVTGVLLFTNTEFLEATSMFEVAALQNTVMSPVPNYIVSVVYCISCLTVAFSATKQALHDMLAGTFCVKQ